MRMTLIVSLAVGIAALAVCLASLVGVLNVAGEAERLRLAVLDQVLAGEMPLARESLTRLGMHWERHTRLLEMISSHDDMHEVTSHILDARVCMDVQDTDDLVRVLEQLGAALEHVRSVQLVNFSNLY